MDDKSDPMLMEHLIVALLSNYQLLLGPEFRQQANGSPTCAICLEAVHLDPTIVHCPCKRTYHRRCLTKLAVIFCSVSKDIACPFCKGVVAYGGQGREDTIHWMFSGELYHDREGHNYEHFEGFEYFANSFLPTFKAIGHNVDIQLNNGNVCPNLWDVEVREDPRRLLTSACSEGLIVAYTLLAQLLNGRSGRNAYGVIGKFPMWIPATGPFIQALHIPSRLRKYLHNILNQVGGHELYMVVTPVEEQFLPPDHPVHFSSGDRVVQRGPCKGDVGFVPFVVPWISTILLERRVPISTVTSQLSREEHTLGYHVEWQREYLVSGICMGQWFSRSDFRGHNLEDTPAVTDQASYHDPPTSNVGLQLQTPINQTEGNSEEEDYGEIT